MVDIYDELMDEIQYRLRKGKDLKPAYGENLMKNTVEYFNGELQISKKAQNAFANDERNTILIMLDLLRKWAEKEYGK